MEEQVVCLVHAGRAADGARRGKTTAQEAMVRGAIRAGSDDLAVEDRVPAADLTDQRRQLREPTADLPTRKGLQSKARPLDKGQGTHARPLQLVEVMR